MTPEQLEEHRVRFEQWYADDLGWIVKTVRNYRHPTGYNHSCLHQAWQAYQWALADADRAQRAAPVVQGGEPDKWVIDPHDMEQGYMLNPAWLSLHGLTAKEAISQQTPPAEPPQQSVQPVYSWATPKGEIYAEADTGKFTMGMLIARDKQDPDYDPTNKHFVYGFHAASPAARLRGYREGLAAAQPVEVQPDYVPLPKTVEQARAMALVSTNWLQAHAPQELMAQSVQNKSPYHGCLRCDTPKKCEIYGCSPLAWPAG